MEPKKLIKPLAVVAVALALGFGLMPLLIFYAGAAALGRYEGGSVGRIYSTVYQGLPAGSVASWVVVLGPCALLLLFKGLAFCWHFGARPANAD